MINVHDEPSWLTRQRYRTLGLWRRPGPTRYWRWKTMDGKAACAAYDHIVAWNPRRIVMAHGDIIEQDAATWLAAALHARPHTTLDG